MARVVRADAQIPGPRGADGAATADRSVVPVLLVDNDNDKRFALGRLLSPLGYAIVEADSGLAALRCVLAQDFAVILLDLRMPGMDGLETAALIRQRRQSELTPIILITASSSDEVAASGQYAESVADFMFAPSDPHQFRATVAAFAKLFLRAQELAAQAREVQASADHLRLLTDTAPVGIYHTDQRNRYVYTNPRWSEITGIPADSAVGQDVGIIVGDEQAPSLLAALGDDVVRPAEISYRFEFRVPAANPRTVLLISRPLPDGAGGFAGRVGTLTV